jgi:hypothetical protein
MGEIEGENVDFRQRRLERVDPVVVRPVAAADEQRPFVEPERVASVNELWFFELARDRHAGPLEVVFDRDALDEPSSLAGSQHDCASIGDECSIEDVDRIGIAHDLRLRQKDLGASRAQRLAESLVLLRELSKIGLGAPAVLTPGFEPGGARRPHENAAKRLRHRLTAEEACGRRGHQPKKAWATDHQSGGTVLS